MEFTKNFNELLKQCGKSQTTIAKDLNLTKQAITNLKSGFSMPSIDVLCQIANYFNISIDDLLGVNLHYEIKEYNQSIALPRSGEFLSDDEKKMIDMYRELERLYKAQLCGYLEGLLLQQRMRVVRPKR